MLRVQNHQSWVHISCLRLPAGPEGLALELSGITAASELPFSLLRRSRGEFKASSLPALIADTGDLRRQRIW